MFIDLKLNWKISSYVHQYNLSIQIVLPHCVFQLDTILVICCFWDSSNRQGMKNKWFKHQNCILLHHMAQDLQKRLNKNILLDKMYKKFNLLDLNKSLMDSYKAEELL